MFKAASTYFLMVFGTGFLLGPIRIFWLVPKVGIRTAELMELPVMIGMIVFSARFINRRFPVSKQEQLFAGFIALGCMVGAELGVAVLLEGRSVRDAFFNRDPVSGTAYYVSLLLFALMPWILDKTLTKPS